MPPVLKEYLLERKRSASDECFVISNGTKPASYNSLQKQIRKLCSSAGVNRISLYELRHSHTELLYEAGASLEDIRRQLNHSSLNATRTYIHRTDDRLKKIVGMVTVGEPALPARPVLRIVRNSPAQ